MKELNLYFLRFLTPYKRVKKVFDYYSVKKELLIKCPACDADGEDYFQDFGYIDRYGYNTHTSWCKSCGLIFINPRMSVEDYDRLYDEGLYGNILEAYKGPVKKPKQQIPKRLEPFIKLLPDYFPQDRAISILDIGGTKNILNYFKQALNIDKYTCINPSLSEIDIQEDGKFRVFKGSIENFPQKGEQFDLICLFGTLNHLLKPRAVFQKVSTLLKDNGLLVFDHVNRVAKMAMASHPIFQIQIDHPIYPGSETLYYLLSEAGLGVIKKYQNLPATDCYFIKKMNMKNFKAINQTYLDEIKHLSNRMKSTPIKFVIKKFTK